LQKISGVAIVARSSYLTQADEDILDWFEGMSSCLWFHILSGFVVRQQVDILYVCHKHHVLPLSIMNAENKEPLTLWCYLLDQQFLDSFKVSPSSNVADLRKAIHKGFAITPPAASLTLWKVSDWVQLGSIYHCRLSLNPAQRTNQPHNLRRPYRTHRISGRSQILCRET